VKSPPIRNISEARHLESSAGHKPAGKQVSRLDHRMALECGSAFANADVTSYTSAADYELHPHRTVARSSNYLIGNRDERRRYGKPSCWRSELMDNRIS